MAVGRRSALKQLTSFGGEPHKLDNTFALGTTSTQYTLLTRGTSTYLTSRYSERKEQLEKQLASVKLDAI